MKTPNFDELNALLEHAYPRGTLEEPDTTAFRTAEDWNRDVATLRAAREEACLHATVFSQMEGMTEVAYTLQETMPFVDWLGWSDQLKLSWLSANDLLEKGYVVLWLKMSRIVPFYSLYLNTWRETGSEGRVGCESLDVEGLDHRWLEAISIFKSHATRAGLMCCDREWTGRFHPTITEIDWGNPVLSSNDSLDEADYPRRPANLGHLIYGEN